MLNLSPNESKLIERITGSKSYDSMSEDELLSAFLALISVKQK